MADKSLAPAIRSSALGQPIGALEPSNPQELMELAKFVARSNLKPAGLQNEADCFLVMAVGMSYGFSAMTALQTLHVVKGKVCLPGETCAALMQAHPLCKSYRVWFEGDGPPNLVACVQTWRTGRDEPNAPTKFSWADAVRAQLTGSDTYKKYPHDMLLHKAEAREKRRNWADIFPGMHVKEDLEGHEERNVTPGRTQEVPVARDPLLASIDAQVSPVSSGGMQTEEPPPPTDGDVSSFNPNDESDVQVARGDGGHDPEPGEGSGALQPAGEARDASALPNPFPGSPLSSIELADLRLACQHRAAKLGVPLNKVRDYMLRSLGVAESKQIRSDQVGAAVDWIEKCEKGNCE